MGLYNWLLKKLGYHVCEEFTQWENKEALFSRPATMEEYVSANTRTIEFTRRWQERQCTICGKIEQRTLRY